MKSILLSLLLCLAAPFARGQALYESLLLLSQPAAVSVTPDLWIVATNVIPVAANGGNVTNVLDISGNGHTFTATLLTPPSYNTNGPNGLPMIDFGTLTFLTNFTFAASLSGSDKPFTVIAVCKRTTSAQTYFQIGSTTDSDTSHAFANDGSAYRDWRRDDGGTIADVTGGTIDSNFHILTSVFDGVNITLYDKSTPIFSAQSQDVGTCTFDATVIGGRMLGGILSSELASGSICEIIVFKGSVPFSSVSARVTALATKYAL